MEDSIFTKIIKGEIPCHKIFEDDKVIAFLDIHPVQEGHMLVVNKKQIDHLEDLDDDSYQHLMSVAHRLSKHIRATLKPARVGMAVIGVDVPHAHVHLFPMEDGHEIKMNHDMSKEPDHDRLAAVAQKLALRY